MKNSQPTHESLDQPEYHAYFAQPPPASRTAPVPFQHYGAGEQPVTRPRSAPKSKISNHGAISKNKSRQVKKLPGVGKVLQQPFLPQHNPSFPGIRNVVSPHQEFPLELPPILQADENQGRFVTQASRSEDEGALALPPFVKKEAKILHGWRQEWENIPDQSFPSLGNQMSTLNRPLNDHQVANFSNDGSNIDANRHLGGPEAQQFGTEAANRMSRAPIHTNDGPHAPANRGAQTSAVAYGLVDLSSECIPRDIVLQALERAYLAGFDDRGKKDALEDDSRAPAVDDSWRESPIMRPHSSSSSPVFYPTSPQVSARTP